MYVYVSSSRRLFRAQHTFPCVLFHRVPAAAAVAVAAFTKSGVKIPHRILHSIEFRDKYAQRITTHKHKIVTEYVAIKSENSFGSNRALFHFASRRMRRWISQHYHFSYTQREREIHNENRSHSLNFEGYTEKWSDCVFEREEKKKYTKTRLNANVKRWNCTMPWYKYIYVFMN